MIIMLFLSKQTTNYDIEDTDDCTSKKSIATVSNNLSNDSKVISIT